MLPYPDHDPASGFESGIGVAITPPVGGNLVLPEGAVRTGLGGVYRTAVPEAAIDEHSDLRRPEHDIDASAPVDKH